MKTPNFTIRVSSEDQSIFKSAAKNWAERCSLSIHGSLTAWILSTLRKAAKEETNQEDG